MDGFDLTAEAFEKLKTEATLQQHPYGKVWSPYDLTGFQEIAENIRQRGLDQEIVLYQGKVLEGWHRYLACLLNGIAPRFVEFKGADLEAAERVHASELRRHSTPDQRIAALNLLCQSCPELQQKINRLAEEGKKRKESGEALSTDAQRVDVLQEKADMAKVSRSTAVKSERLQKLNPKALHDVAAGKTTTNVELKKIKNSVPTSKKTGDSKPQAPPTLKIATDDSETDSKAIPEDDRCVMLTVPDDWVAHLKEFLSDSGIKPSSNRKDWSTQFEYETDLLGLGNVLTAIQAILLVTKTKPVDLLITLTPTGS